MGTRPVARGGFFGRTFDSFNALAFASPARFTVGVFIALIVVFTALLSLPIATAAPSGTGFADALLTAVSVICVTGLSTVDMATNWSAFGNGVVLVGVEIGGVGALTLASILGLVISRKVGLRAKLMAASDSNPLRSSAARSPKVSLFGGGRSAGCSSGVRTDARLHRVR